MLIAILWRLEGGGHIENRLPVLDGGYPTGAEAVAVAQHLHIVNDRLLAIAGAKSSCETNEPDAQRARSLCRIQRLTHYLAAKNLT